MTSGSSLRVCSLFVEVFVEGKANWSVKKRTIRREVYSLRSTIYDLRSTKRQHTFNTVKE